MNIKRFLVAAVALFAFIFVYESGVHGFLLKPIYLETPSLWRSCDQMMAYMPFNIVIMGLIAFWLTFIFTRLFQEGGLKNGLHFGVYLGVLSAIQALGAYFYLPISETLAACWFATYLVESILGGCLIGLIYKK